MIITSDARVCYISKQIRMRKDLAKYLKCNLQCFKNFIGFNFFSSIQEEITVKGKDGIRKKGERREKVSDWGNFFNVFFNFETLY